MKHIIFLIFITISSLIQAQIIHIPGDYPTIQSGINAASDGDTVLVEPGLYPENINFTGKAICVASQYIFTQDPDDISQTIIHPDNYDTSSVKFENGEDSTAILAGFKIYGGYMYQGSGIFCKDASPVLRNLIITGGGPGFWGGLGGGIYLENSQAKLKELLITENSSTDGGGIYMENSGPTLENVTVQSNSSFIGGGISCYSSSPVFDSISRCNIYLNKAAYGNDLYCSGGLIEVILDTFTVCNPTSVHASPLSEFSFYIMNCKLEQVSADLYISPSGSDENNGLTEDDPMKSIHSACLKLLADSLNRHTIHLLEGLYSPSANGEFFPVSPPEFVDIVGVSKEEVILDAGGTANVLSIIFNQDILVSSMTLRNGDAGNGIGGGGITCHFSKPVLRDLILSGNIATYWGTGENGGGAYFSYSNPILENILIKDNMATNGGGISISYANEAWLKNVVITGNESFGGSGIECFQSNLYIDNTSIADNLEGAGIRLGDTWASINNSIIWGNEGGQISGSALVKYSDIMGGYQGEGNINIDPMFEGSGDHPYALGVFSPCIDRGTPDTTGLNLPPWDILGNYRVWDGDGDGIDRIDMGAYEFGAEPVGVGESLVVSRWSLVVCYPNPCDEYTTFEYQLEKPGSVSLSIYNNLGQKVEVLVDEIQDIGLHQIKWNAKNHPPGIYFLNSSAIGHRPSTIVKVVVVR